MLGFMMSFSSFASSLSGLNALDIYQGFDDSLLLMQKYEQLSESEKFKQIVETVENSHQITCEYSFNESANYLRSYYVGYKCGGSQDMTLKVRAIFKKGEIKVKGYKVKFK